MAYYRRFFPRLPTSFGKHQTQKEEENREFLPLLPLRQTSFTFRANTFLCFLPFTNVNAERIVYQWKVVVSPWQPSLRLGKYWKVTTSGDILHLQVSGSFHKAGEIWGDKRVVRPRKGKRSGWRVECWGNQEEKIEAWKKKSVFVLSCAHKGDISSSALHE